MSKGVCTLFSVQYLSGWLLELIIMHSALLASILFLLAFPEVAAITQCQIIERTHNIPIYDSIGQKKFPSFLLGSTAGLIIKLT